MQVISFMDPLRKPREKKKFYQNLTSEQRRAHKIATQRSYRRLPKVAIANRARFYNVTFAEMEELLSRENCDICGRPLPTLGSKNIDHDHLTNKIRGVLCTRCNVALASFGDTEAGLQIAARYVDAFCRSSLSIDSGEKFLSELDNIAKEDVEGLRTAFQSYGPSWKMGGGVNAFFMLKRKWDRLYNRLSKPEISFDIFKGIATDIRGEGVIDDVRDLRRYLALVEAEMRARGFDRTHRDNK
jgi:hypothetical protein